MVVTVEDIVETAQRHGTLYDDLVGVGNRIVQRKAAFVQQENHRAEVAAEAILAYTHMWHEVGNEHPSVQKKHWQNMGVHPLYSKHSHNPNGTPRFNPMLIALDYLLTFKGLLEVRAAGKHTGDPFYDWLQAQEELATQLVTDGYI